MESYLPSYPASLLLAPSLRFPPKIPVPLIPQFHPDTAHVQNDIQIVQGNDHSSRTRSRCNSEWGHPRTRSPRKQPSGPKQAARPTAKSQKQQLTTSVGLDKVEAHRRGEAFEKYLEDEVFRACDFALHHRTPSYAETQSKYDADALLPDFKFSCRQRKKVFWLEAKFRDATMEGKVEWCRYDQLKRYREEESKVPVFVAIGLGGRPGRPDRLFVVPLDALKFTGVYLKILAPYEVKKNRTMTSDRLWKLVSG